MQSRKLHLPHLQSGGNKYLPTYVIDTPTTGQTSCNQNYVVVLIECCYL